MDNRSHWVAWAAGALDGEGCIFLSRGKHKRCREFWTLRVSVSNTDPKMLIRFKELFGGTITSNGVPKGCNLRSWKWGIRSGLASEALKEMLPWLITKHEQAELAILSRSLMGRSGSKGSADLPALRLVHSTLQKLKRLPQEMPDREYPLKVGEIK